LDVLEGCNYRGWEVIGCFSVEVGGGCGFYWLCRPVSSFSLLLFFDVFFICGIWFLVVSGIISL